MFQATVLLWAIVCMSVTQAILSDIHPHVSDASGRRLESDGKIKWRDDNGKSDAFLELDPSEMYQKFDGMGGSFMRAGAKLFNMMPKQAQDDIIRDFFDPKEGAGFVLGKIPIGATDFGVPYWYTYADEVQSEDLPEFSMKHDLLESEDGFVPFVKRAQHATGGRLRLEATLDYPPDWMLNTSTPLPWADVNSTYIPALANYYYKYYKELARNGVNLEFISLFNELTDSYVNCSYPNTWDLLVNYVSPMFRKDPEAPKLTWTAKFGRRVSYEASPAFYEMEGVQEAIDVIFYHGYDCNYGPAEGLGWQCMGDEGRNTTCPYLEDSAELMKKFYDEYGRDRTIWMTELCYASEFGDYNVSHGCPTLPRLDWDDSMQWGDMIYADLNIVGANGWIYWNLLLDTTGGPWLTSPEHNDPDPNEQQPLVVVDPSTGKYYKTGGYYAMAHFSKFIALGSTRIGSTAVNMYPTVKYTAFHHPSKGTTVVLMNDDPEEHSFDLKYKGKVARVTMPPVSFVTLDWNEM